jgi:hypothetical protein
MTGQMQHAWERLQRQVLIVGSPPRLIEAVDATRDTFWRNAEPRYRRTLAMARTGSDRPMPLIEWRRWTIGALRQTLLARDAAIIEAVARGTTLAVEAEQHMAIAGAATLGLLLLTGGAVLVLLRRLVLPVQRLTATVTRLAGGDVAAAVPERSRGDRGVPRERHGIAADKHALRCRPEQHVSGTGNVRRPGAARCRQ